MLDVKQKIKASLESASLAIILIFVFLPVRLFFVQFVSSNWFGSFGVITAVSVLILILAKKNKLGWFGTAYLKQLYKANRGKRKYIFYFFLIFTTFYLMAVVYSINVGQTDTEFKEIVKEVKEEVPYKSVDDLVEASQNEVQLEDIPMGLLAFIYITFVRFDIFIVLNTYLNDLSGGWVLHFATVFLIEELEVLGLLILYKFVIKTPQS